MPAFRPAVPHGIVAFAVLYVILCDFTAECIVRNGSYFTAEISRNDVYQSESKYVLRPLTMLDSILSRAYLVLPIAMGNKHYKHTALSPVSRIYNGTL